MAVAILGMSLSTKMYLYLVDQGTLFLTVELGFFLIDFIVALSMVVVALRANRIYTLWMAGFQIIAMLSHFARGMTDAISPIAYAIMTIGPSYFLIIILAFGIWFHHRRVRRLGSYRSWRTSSSRSPETPPPN